MTAPTLPRAGAPTRSRSAIGVEGAHLARNYHPLPVVLAEGEGSWVTDVEGRRYLDFLSAYSALNFGHRHPALVAAAHRQLERITLTSRAFHNDQLGPYAEAVSRLTGHEAMLPMNTGAEGVETALKLARKWAYERKGVPAGQAEIVVFAGNFHGRTTTIVSFSDDPSARDGFGPFTPGFVTVPFGDADALAAALNDRTAAVLMEPIQGEAGVILPPAGFHTRVGELCAERNVLLIADEIQSGLGRTGRTFACQHEGVQPDVMILGKALGGGIVPASAVTADWRVLEVLRPGEHGSTFGGNPLAAAVGQVVVELLLPGTLQARSARLGAHVLDTLRAAELPGVVEVRGCGLWWAIQLAEGGRSGRAVAEELLAAGLLAKDTHGTTIRFAPPLTISEADLDLGLAIIVDTLRGG
ncbi:MAG: ornithine--oxo-acid transaminase [Acidimicrobiales bacterium]